MLCPICGSEAFCDDCINLELQYAYADTRNKYLQTSGEYFAGEHDGLSSTAAAPTISSEAVEV